MKPWLKILIGLVLGVITGIILNRQVEILSLIGSAFINLLKMLVGLIVFSSLVIGMCHIDDPRRLGKIGSRTLLFYGVTTVIAITIGIITSFAIRPGVGLNMELPPGTTSESNLSLLDFLFSIVPSNPFAAFAEPNVLQIIVFAVFFALAINLAKDKGKPLLRYIESLGEVMTRLTQVVMRFAPYGVFALIATAIGKMGFDGIKALFWAILCIYIACFIQTFAIFSLSLRYLGKVKVAPFFKGMKDAIVVAFTTCSSSATLPVSLECARDHLGISHDISGFVLSLGSTINMNGTAIGQAVLSIFIAQIYGIEMTFVKIVILYFTALVSAIGTAGIPGSGLVMLSLVFNALGLPLEGIGLVAGIDRLRDMAATVVNILGDAVAAVYVAQKESQFDEKKYHAVTWVD
ncbi:MAG: dicarboxylate/amino acid:cation symporter [Simkania negevensis]|nr:dicarboxylate/amino acid:cation symporter [Simkania negevensis]